MSYQLGYNERVQESIRRIGREQIDKAIGEIDNPDLDRHEAIHQVRKRCKRLRALVRLVRPALGRSYQRENGCFRGIARDLSGIRDEQSMVEALERLLESLKDAERHPFDPALSELRARRDAAAASAGQDPEALLAEARKSLKKARNRVGKWQLNAGGFGAVDGGFNKTYKRGHKAIKRAYKTDKTQDFHEWRKRVKYHVHHLDLLRPLWPRVTKAWRKEAKVLADILGDDHDLAILDELLESEGERLAESPTRRQLQQIIRKKQQRLRREALEISHRLYAEKPGALRKRWKSYWRTWQAFGNLSET
ncbi:MAG: CHAD domain-containing protein [Oleiphilaceae bacterium]|nr:CHAD domain-containing protein [Oleiphilaceae bacterium]